MSAAPEQPVGRFDAQSGKFQLTESWTCTLHKGYRLLISAGFLSDGASIPRFLWSVVGPRLDAKTFPAALAHDALYLAQYFPRRVADNTFFRLLIRCGCRRTKAVAYWLAVRVFGGIFWRRVSDIDRRATRHIAKVYNVVAD